LGSLVLFPRAAARRSDTQRRDPSDASMRSTRTASEGSLTRLDVKRVRDGEDDGDGGGGSAA